MALAFVPILLLNFWLLMSATPREGDSAGDGSGVGLTVIAVALAVVVVLQSSSTLPRWRHALTILGAFLVCVVLPSAALNLYLQTQLVPTRAEVRTAEHAGAGKDLVLRLPDGSQTVARFIRSSPEVRDTVDVLADPRGWTYAREPAAGSPSVGGLQGLLSVLGVLALGQGIASMLTRRVGLARSRSIYRD